MIIITRTMFVITTIARVHPVYVININLYKKYFRL